MKEENGEWSDAPYISLECKNYSDGVDAYVLKKVFKRIDSSIKFCFVFVSSLKKGEIFKNATLTKVKEACFKKSLDLCLTVSASSDGRRKSTISRPS